MFYTPGFLALLLIKAGEPASFGITVELLVLSSAAAIIGGLSLFRLFNPLKIYDKYYPRSSLLCTWRDLRCGRGRPHPHHGQGRC